MPVRCLQRLSNNKELSLIFTNANLNENHDGMKSASQGPGILKYEAGGLHIARWRLTRWPRIADMRL